MKKLILIATAMMSACASISNTNRFPDSVGQCPISEKNPPVFTVLENANGKIKVQLGDFTKLFDVPDSYNVKVTFEDFIIQDSEGTNTITNVTEITPVTVSKKPYVIEIPVTRSGIYNFALADGDKVFWKQKVFGIDPEENMISKDEREKLAQQFAPIMEMAPGEEIYPSTLEYIFNKEDVDPQLNAEPFLITNKNTQSGFLNKFSRGYKFTVNFNYEDFSKVLPFYGNADSVIKSGLANDKQTRLRLRNGKNNLAVYYSVFEHRKSIFVNRDKQVKVVTMPSPYIYINYHFFYAYDTKNGTIDKPVAASHFLDRESMTVVLNNSRKPIMVIYGAHLASQLMAQLDSSGKRIQEWKGGRAYLNTAQVPTENGRILAVAAKGSHGIYPVAGKYAVALGESISLLTEDAGRGAKLYPSFEPTAGSNPKYKLLPLGLENVTSNCGDGNHAELAYSGAVVDVLGPTNAAFPPFTDREGDYKNYTDPNMYMFVLDKAK
ncbi:hypothetical protein CIK05_15355 [Bdellovibrio sp. qaytius]|nr:hypothetical protein CIK05_15355 [Bdellovibrio sp. qaytius]